MRPAKLNLLWKTSLMRVVLIRNPLAGHKCYLMDHWLLPQACFVFESHRTLMNNCFRRLWYNCDSFEQLVRLPHVKPSGIYMPASRDRQLLSCRWGRFECQAPRKHALLIGVHVSNRFCSCLPTLTDAYTHVSSIVTKHCDYYLSFPMEASAHVTKEWVRKW
jgi:hypothetical protein